MCLRAWFFSPLMGVGISPCGHGRLEGAALHHMIDPPLTSAPCSGAFRVSSDSPPHRPVLPGTTVQPASLHPQGFDWQQQPEVQGSSCSLGPHSTKAVGKMPQPSSPQADSSRICRKLVRSPRSTEPQGLPTLLPPPASGHHLPKKPLAHSSCSKLCFQRETQTL